MQESLLFVNACQRERGVSRTLALCDSLLDSFSHWKNPPKVEECLLRSLDLRPLDPETLDRRESLLHTPENADDLLFLPARQFAAADLIVVGAPYWDLSFPAALKCYIEQICANGITFHYTESGSEGLCRARALVYVTSAGGMIGEDNHGYTYLKAVARMLGITRTEFLSIEGLDIQGLDPLPEQKKSAQWIDAISAALEPR